MFTAIFDVILIALTISFGVWLISLGIKLIVGVWKIILGKK